MDARRRRGGGNFSFGHILGDPFALGTISLAFMGWLVALIGSVITQMKSDFNKFYWWALAYMLCCIIGVTIVVMTGEPEKYQIAVVGFMAVAVAYNTFAVSSVVFSATAEQEAAAAGFILLSMMSILWIGYFGTSSQARPRGYIDSFALNKEQRLSMRGSRPMSTNPYDGRTPNNASGGQPQMYSSTAMNGGLEQSSNMSGYQGGGPGGMGTGASTSQPRFAQQPMQSSAPRSPVAGTAPGGGFGGAGGAGGLGGGDAAAANVPLTGEIPNPTEYPYRAKAIYSYEANPDDANEISFTKHEILEVSDVSGRWWQARKENGETGIAPSNYLILL